MAGALARMQAALDQRLKRLEVCLTAVEATLGHVWQIAALVECLFSLFPWCFNDKWQLWNKNIGSGGTARLEVMPFVNGEDPTTHPVCILNSFYLMLTLF